MVLARRAEPVLGSSFEKVTRLWSCNNSQPRYGRTHPGKPKAGVTLFPAVRCRAAASTGRRGTHDAASHPTNHERRTPPGWQRTQTDQPTESHSHMSAVSPDESQAGH